MTKSNSEKGVCSIEEIENTSKATKHRPLAIHYVGDPMCSWCWGISNTVEKVEEFCKDEGIKFTITMGGLRSGGGDMWTREFKTFLKNEWGRIAKVTGQPFGYTLLEESHFDYNTEPACRAVVTAKILQKKNDIDSSTILKFFSSLQRKFYVEGKDPKESDFYNSICSDLEINFEDFYNLFNSKETIDAVNQEFADCRTWGVRSFPTLLFESHGKKEILAAGYITLEEVLSLLKGKLKC